MGLLAEGGRDALTTRAVAEAARVQPPILYRLFHDKTGLLHALADYGFGVYMRKKRPDVSPEDPVEALRVGWKLHIDFGLTHPELYLLMYAEPQGNQERGTAARSHQLLRDHMQRVAAAGRLRISADRAAHLFHSAACGLVLSLLGMETRDRDMTLSELACDMALATIATDGPVGPAPVAAQVATTLRALLEETEASLSPAAQQFTPSERALFLEWLKRVSDCCPE